MLCSAHEEISSIVSEIRVKRALLTRPPLALEYVIAPGDSVRVYREREKRWSGPCKVFKVDNKEIWVTEGINTKHFNKT